MDLLPGAELAKDFCNALSLDSSSKQSVQLFTSGGQLDDTLPSFRHLVASHKPSTLKSVSVQVPAKGSNTSSLEAAARIFSTFASDKPLMAVSC